MLYTSTQWDKTLRHPLQQLTAMKKLGLGRVMYDWVTLTKLAGRGLLKLQQKLVPFKQQTNSFIGF